MTDKVPTDRGFAQSGSNPGHPAVVVVNLSREAHTNYTLGFPSPGTWRLRLNSDWNGYSSAFANQVCSNVVIDTEQDGDSHDAKVIERDGFPAAGTISIGSYSVLVFSQDSPADREQAHEGVANSDAPRKSK